MTLNNRAMRAFRNDQGVALPMVILIFVVITALVSAVTIAVIGSSQVTTSNRAGVQAQAAADAGVDAAFATLSGNLCQSVPADSSELVGPAGAQVPMYRLQISFLSASGGASNCTSGTQVRVLSTGYAADGTSTQRVEAVRSISTTPAPTPTPSTGDFPAVINGTGGYVPFPITSGVTGLKSDVLLISGKADCQNAVGGRIGTDNGEVYMSSKCVSQGDVWGTTRLDLQGTVNGNAYLISSSAESVYLSGTVNGNIYTNAKSVDLQGTVTGNVIHINPAATSFYMRGKISGNIHTTAESVQIQGAVGGDVVHLRDRATSFTYDGSGDISGAIWTTAKNAKFQRPVKSQIVQINDGASGTEFYIDQPSKGSLWTTSNKMSVRNNVGEVGAPKAVTQNSGSAAEFELADGRTIVGDVWVSGKVTIQGSLVRGNVTAAGATQSTVAPANGLRITGNLTTGGPVSTWNGGNGTTEQQLKSFPAVQGTVKLNQTVSSAGITNPTAPTLSTLPPQPTTPGWLEYSYDAAVWQEKAGFLPQSVIDLAAQDACAPRNKNDAGFKLIDEALRTQNGKITLDGSNCAGQVSFHNLDFTLNSDVVIVVPKGITLQGSSWSSSATRLAWVVQSDTNVKDNKPTCPANGNAIDLQVIDVRSSVNMSIYTPCQVDMGGNSNYRGHIVAGSRNFWSASPEIVYYPVGLPGSAWATGTGTTPTPGPGTSGTRTLGALQSQRNISG